MYDTQVLSQFLHSSLHMIPPCQLYCNAVMIRNMTLFTLSPHVREGYGFVCLFLFLYLFL